MTAAAPTSAATTAPTRSWSDSLGEVGASVAITPEATACVGRRPGSHTLSRMLTALHTLIYSDDPEATRAFFRDVLGWPHVEHPESASGWLIFKSGPSELGVHPTSGTHGGHDYSYPLQHKVSLMCDDIEATIAELEARGAQFSGPPRDLGFGIAATLEIPGAGEMLVYEPRHPEAHSL